MKKTAIAFILTSTLTFIPTIAFAYPQGAMMGNMQQPGFLQGGQQMFQPFDGMNGLGSSVNLESSPLEIVTSEIENTAKDLEVNEASATFVTMSDTDATVKISDPGTYIITGTCSDGTITVKKGVTGVVLVLRELDLTSTVGAPYN